jgi:hypothetical protein
MYNCRFKLTVNKLPLYDSLLCKDAMEQHHLKFSVVEKAGEGAPVSLPGQCASIPALYAPGYTF